MTESDITPDKVGTIPGNGTGTDVDILGNSGMDRYSDEVLHELKTFKDAFGLLEASGSIPEDYADAYGTGFAILKDKSKLNDVPFAVLEWRFSKGSYGENSYFVSMLVMTEKDDKYVVNDGSTGICEQMRKVTASRIERGATPEQARRGLLVRGGLSQSDFKVEVPDSKTGELTTIEATTFYLAN